MRARYLRPVHRPQWSGPFAEVTGRVSYGLPGQPTGPTFSGVTGDRATLRWEAPPNSKVTGYRVTRSSGDGPEQTVASDTGSTLTEYADAGLSPETTYAYRVTALNDLGPGPDSDAFSVTTAAPAVDPDLPAPPGLASSFDEEGRVTLGWDEPQGSAAGEVTGYRILRGPDAESLAPLVRDTGNTATSWTDLTASAGATYVYAVRSRTAGSMSELSDTLTVTALAPPADLAGDDGPGGGVLLSWSATAPAPPSGGAT